MPSKTSKPRPGRPCPWKAWRDCSEPELESAAAELAGELKAGDRVLLEGPMGVGKSTFARALLVALGVTQTPEGSPTFAIAHEYESPRGGIVHIDLYRIKSEAEIDDAGIPSYFWERDLIVIAEWVSMWPDFEKTLLLAGEEGGGQRAWRVNLSFSAERPADPVRNLAIARL